jgi:hypothetical protein
MDSGVWGRPPNAKGILMCYPYSQTQVISVSEEFSPKYKKGRSVSYLTTARRWTKQSEIFAWHDENFLPYWGRWNISTITWTDKSSTCARTTLRLPGSWVSRTSKNKLHAGANAYKNTSFLPKIVKVGNTKMPMFSQDDPAKKNVRIVTRSSYGQT